MANEDFKHKMTYGESLAKISKYLGYDPIYIFEGERVTLGELTYLMNEEVTLVFDTEHGSTTDNMIDIIFSDGRKLSPLPF
jgi:hypothetical protein